MSHSVELFLFIETTVCSPRLCLELSDSGWTQICSLWRSGVPEEKKVHRKPNWEPPWEYHSGPEQAGYHA